MTTWGSAPYGLFLISVPLQSSCGRHRFGDRCYAETVRLASEFVQQSVIVARVREHAEALGTHPDLEEVRAVLGHTLPDYGVTWQQWLRRIRCLLTDPHALGSLRELVKRAAFIYTDAGTSPEACLVAHIAQQAGRSLILEVRGTTVLNWQYMWKRFGPVGPVYLATLSAFFRYVRRRSLAGLYINQRLMKQYPITGELRAAVSDALLPDDFGAAPRTYTKVARSYLYVGHLETVKRVDLILRALHTARKRLPPEWRFDVVGSGPLESDLRALARRLDIEEHVTFHGRVEWGEPLAQFYRRADLALVASMTESGPRSLAEAMAFSLPVLSTAVGNAPDLLDEPALAPVGNADEYAIRLARLANDPSILTRFSAHNWQLAQGFRRSALLARRRAFWKQAIQASQQTTVW